MIKEIKYSGYTAQPSDYSCPDGDLSLSLGCIPDNGSLRPVFPPKTVMTLANGEDVIYIHKIPNTDDTHYIVYNASSGYLKAIDASSNSVYQIGTLSGVTAVNSVGNTLVALSSTGMYYWLWKKGTYLSLGNHIPELPIQFGLSYDWEQSDEFKVEYGDHWLMYDSSKYGYAFCNKYGDGTVGGVPNAEYISQRVMAQANKFIADKATNNGRFIYPFLVRYAFRLFDGNYTMVSAPILMPCVTGCSPIPLVTNRSYNGNGDAQGYFECWWLRITAPVFDLMYRVTDSYALSSLKNWSDIVKSVDIFISKPVYTYDQNGKIENNAPINTINFSVYGSNTGDSNGYSIQQAFNRIRKYITDLNNNKATDKGMGFITPLPARSADSIQGDIESTGNFFLLKSYNLDELKTSLDKVEIKSDYLQSLVNRTQLPADDYDSHDTIIPTFSFAYNQRLNITGITKSLFQGYKPECLVTYQEIGSDIRNIWVYIRQDGEDIVVNCKPSTTVHGSIQYFFYPNANAYKAVVQYSSGYSTYTLSNHPLLNGAYYFKGFTSPQAEYMSAPVASSKPYVHQPSKVYTSAVNNPFFFPLKGINTIGTGEIKGICAAARPLSQGQFGQFPLYCFSSDGIWALEVGSDGFYKARQPISRDVCTNPDSITQLDSSVVFVTDRGIMHISGSATECLSDIIDTETPFDISALPHADAVIVVFKDFVTNDNEQKTKLPASFTIQPFRTYLKGCRIVYDYTHQYIIVFNPSYNYAYLYSNRSQAWGMMLLFHRLAHSVNSYPDAMAMDADNRLVNFSQYGATEEAFLLITRPLKLDNPDIHKTIDTIIQRGTFPKGNVCQVLYGSRDMSHWQLVWSSTDHYLRGFAGTSYKYYRLAVIGRLRDGDTLYGSTVQYVPRLTDQPR